jgi:hypothetical protein
MLPVLTSDRLYGITLRPQEMDLYGHALTFELRYAPMVDDPSESSTTHFKLLVLEINAALTPEDQRAFGAPAVLQVAKCGWEAELTTAQSVAAQDLPELPEEVPLLLGRISDTINELARRARLAEPLGPDVVGQLVYRYRTRGIGG